MRVISKMEILSPSIEFRHLHYFLMAAEYGSFRRASVAAGVNRSVISRRVRDLEDEIGASLFIRHSGGVHLTLAGKVFFEHARKVLQDIRNATIEVATFGRGAIRAALSEKRDRARYRTTSI